MATTTPTSEKASKSRHEQRGESTSKIGAIPVLLKMELAFIKHMFTAPFRGKNGASTYKRDVLYAAIRQLLGGLSTAQVQIAPGTDTTYKIACRLEHQKVRSVELGGGARGNWIGKKEAGMVMLYIHGGGFYGAATVGHQRYQFALQKEMQKQGHDFAIFSLSYTLSPNAVYPTQLNQALSALRHLIEVEHRDPSTILIAGDSAGGNLASALLLHLARPHPSVPAIKLSRPLHGALLISPWISFETEGTSFTKNARSDYITIEALHRAANAYIAVGTEHDQYSQPISAPVEWWRDVASSVVDKMMIWGGESEVLIDGIQMFARTVKSGFAEADKAGSVDRFVFVTSPGHAHEEMIIDFLPFMKTKGHGAVQTEEWLSMVLGNKTRNG